MSPISAPPTLPPKTYSVSKELSSSLLEIESDLRSTYTNGHTNELIMAISRVARDCAEEGWDGYEASPVSNSALIDAVDFARSLPWRVDIPDVAPTPTGGVSFEWRKEDSTILIASIEGDGLVYYASVGRSGEEENGSKSFSGELPEVLSKLLGGYFS